MHTDRNLLFGVLALQADLIDNDQFVKGCAFWTTDKDKALSQILIEQRWITPNDRADVDRLLERKLRKHHGDARASLAEMTTDRVRESLAELPDADVHESLIGITPPPKGAILVNTTAYSPQSRERYSLARLHATGGIGRVWLARDDMLGRDVALKEIRPERANSPTLWSRFLKEAQITCQLEHPGIVPIYELGRKPDSDEPFYTMRFVRGRTLAQAARSYHARRERNESKALEFRDLLTAFVGVCNAVAYAHSRGVIHRDLKPQNVVLGDYGEVMLLDWGLAKVGGQTEDAAEPVSVTESSDQTVAGQVLGTPAYMSPEQAEGRPDLLDARTDVYGLGAILYELLTGEPPFDAENTQDLLQQVRSDTPIRPRAYIASTPAALDAICLRAMAKEQNARYPSALEMAQEVQHWLADEPVTAFREPFVARVGRWSRRHKPIVAGVAALLVTAVVALSASTLLVAREKHNAEQARARAEQLRVQAEASALAEQSERAEADTQRQRAQANFGKAREAVDHMLTQVGDRRLRDVPQLERLRKELLEEALRFNTGFLQERSDDPAMQLEMVRALARVAVIRRDLGQRELAIEAMQKSNSLIRQLVAREPDNIAYKRELSAGLNDLGVVLERKGDFEEAEKLYDEALSLLREIVKGPKVDMNLLAELANVHNNRGSLLETTKRTREALTAYSEAEYIRLRLVGLVPKEPRFQQLLGTSYYNYGNLYYARQQYPDAEKNYRRSLEIRHALVKEYSHQPDYAEELASALLGLGNVLQYTDRFAEAEKNFVDTISLLESLAMDYPAFPDYRRSLGICQFNLGNVRYEQRKIAEATTAYDAAFVLQRRLVDDFPGRLEFLDALMSTRLSRGNVLQEGGKLEDAIREFREVLEYQKKQKDVADNLDRQLSIGVLCSNLGNAYYHLRNYKEAESYYRSALPYQERLFNLEPDGRNHAKDLGGTLLSIGNVCQYSGRPKDAEAAFNRVIEISERLVEKRPENPQYLRLLGIAWFNRGNLFGQVGRFRESRESYEKAIPLQEKLVARFAGFGGGQKDLSETYNNLAMLLADCADIAHRDPKQALTLALKSVQLMSQSGDKWNTVGICRCRLGQWKECTEDMEKAMKLRDGGDSNDWYFLAIAHHKLGNQDDAKTWFTRAAKWRTEHAAQDANLKRYHDEAREVLGIKD